MQHSVLVFFWLNRGQGAVLGCNNEKSKILATPSHFDVESCWTRCPDGFSHWIDFLLRHGLGWVAILDSVAVARSLVLLKNVNKFHFFHQIAVKLTNEIVEIVRIEIFRYPE